MSEAAQTATHAAGHAENAGDHAESATGAQCIDVAGGARGRVTGGRGTWLVPPDTSAEQRAELARDGAEVRDGWWLEVAVWTAGDART